MILRQKLVKFIQENLIGEGESVQIDENEPLIDRGLIDSLGLMQIITFIEEQTRVRIPDDEVFPANFQTVVSIEQMVQRLKSKG